MPAPRIVLLELAAEIAPDFRRSVHHTARRVKVIASDGRVKKLITTDDLRRAILRRVHIEFGKVDADFRECLTCRFPFLPERKSKKFCSDVCRARAYVAMLTPAQVEERHRKNSEWHAKRTSAQRAKKAARERARYAERLRHGLPPRADRAFL